MKKLLLVLILLFLSVGVCFADEPSYDGFGGRLVLGYQWVIQSDSWYDVPFATAPYELGVVGTYYNDYYWGLVAPIDGLYLMTGMVRWYPRDGGVRLMEIRNSTGSVLLCQEFGASGDGVWQYVHGCSTVAYLTHGDTVYMRVRQSTGSELEVMNASHLTVTYLGQWPHAESHAFWANDHVSVSDIISVTGVLTDSESVVWDSQVNRFEVFGEWTNRFMEGIRMPRTETEALMIVAGLLIYLMVGASVRMQTVAVFAYLVLALVGLWDSQVALTGGLVVLLVGAMFNKFLGAVL